MATASVCDACPASLSTDTAMRMHTKPNYWTPKHTTYFSRLRARKEQEILAFRIQQGLADQAKYASIGNLKQKIGNLGSILLQKLIGELKYYILVLLYLLTYGGTKAVD